MKAIVCDACGKVILLSEAQTYHENNGVHRLIGDILDRGEVDLCDDCAGKLLEAVRNQTVLQAK
jgi:hypothetical protein